MPKEQGRKLVAQNRKARHDYHIEDTYEAGLVLVGTEVKSLRAGRATLVDGFAEIDHGVHFGVGVATISNHLSGYAVSVGDHVEKGQTVGYVGTTGWSTGCHLHFTVLANGQAVDPMQWF